VGGINLDQENTKRFENDRLLAFLSGRIRLRIEGGASGAFTIFILLSWNFACKEELELRKYY